MATWLNIAFVDIKFMYFFFSRSIYQGRDEIKRKEKKMKKTIQKEAFLAENIIITISSQ